MSKNEILYVKGLNKAEYELPVDEESEEDIWDDTKLNQAYDKAVSIANTEIAKRIAMATNSSSPTEAKVQHTAAEPKNSKSNSKQKGGNTKQKKAASEWKVGMPCRAVYEEDGLEYEAFLLRIVDDEECVVRFLGYENSEVVSIGSLKPSLGNKVRAQQIQEALYNNVPNTEDEEDQHKMDCSSEKSTEKSQRRRKKSAKKAKKHSHEMPTGLPFRMPDLPSFNNFPPMDFPMAMPPPMMPTPLPDGNAEEQAMCSMLLSWYCSGYYTGLYQGMKRAKQQNQSGGRSSH